MDEQFETAGTPGAGQPETVGEPTTATTAGPDGQAKAGRPARLPARIGTIVWGFLVTGFAVVVALASGLVNIEDPTAWLIGGLVVGGAALIVAGIAASLRRAS